MHFQIYQMDDTTVLDFIRYAIYQSAISSHGDDLRQGLKG